MGDISESMFAEEVLTSSVAAIPAVKLDELPPGEAGDAIGVKEEVYWGLWFDGSKLGRRKLLCESISTFLVAFACLLVLIL